MAKNRRSAEEVAKLVAEIDALRAGGMGADAAADKVGLARSVYARHKKPKGQTRPVRVTGSVRADSLPPRPKKKPRGNVHTVDKTSMRSVASRIAYLDKMLARQQGWVDERIELVGVLIKLLKAK